MVGMLVLEGMDLVDWIEVVLVEYEAFIGWFMDFADKLKVRVFIFILLIYFFKNGMVSLTTSPTVLANDDHFLGVVFEGTDSQLILEIGIILFGKE